MRRLIYTLFLFIGWSQILTAHETNPLEISLNGLPFDLGSSWYQAQKDAWASELKKNARSEKAWDNYASACLSLWKNERDDSKKQAFQKELRTVMKKMKKYIPETRAYYRCLLAQATDGRERERIQQHVLSLKRTSERDYIDDISYCHNTRQIEKIKELAVEWYESGMFSSDFLSYFYNELAGMEKNSVLIAEPTMGLSYRYLLQYGLGLFKDIEIVSSVDLEFPEQGAWFWQQMGVDPKIFEGSKSIAPGAEYFLEREKRPVYFSQHVLNRRLLETLKTKLYPEGLVLKYSVKPYNNLAVARRNYEQVYLLDYLRRPWSGLHPGITYGGSNDWNYVVSFTPLLQFYRASGDKNQYLKLKSLLQGILDRSRSSKPVTAYEKVYEAVMARLKEMSEQGEVFIKSDDKRDEYQKLIDGVAP